MSLVMSAAGYSQKYHYSSIYGVNGPVKEIKTVSKNKFVEKKVKIGKDGRGGVSMMVYDDGGYPVGFELSMLGRENFQRYFFDGNNRLDSVSVKIHSFGKPMCVDVKNSYNGKEQTKQILYLKEGDDAKVYQSLFSDYSFDEHGNWVSRFVIRRAFSHDGNEKTEEFTETRKIKYYAVDD